MMILHDPLVKTIGIDLINLKQLIEIFQVYIVLWHHKVMSSFSSCIVSIERRWQ